MREQHSLAGDWEAIQDRENTGKAADWQHWPENVATQAEPIDVPGPWNLKWPEYAGVVFYHREFVPPPGWQGRRVALQFAASNYYTEVWINGHNLGDHEGGYTPFSFDVQEQLLWDQPNHLVVRVLDPPREGEIDGFKLAEIPCAKETWYHTMGGLHGEVTLECTSKQYLDEITVTPSLADSTATISVRVQGQKMADSEVLVQILDPAQNEVARAVAQRSSDRDVFTALLSLPEAQPWTPEKPALYTAHVELRAQGKRVDVCSMRFGMRDFTLRKGRFYLNGQPIILKGVLLQPDYPRTMVLMNRDLARKELELMKDAGVNLVRSHVRPSPPFYLDMADEMGLLVYQETAAGFLQLSDHAQARCERELREMITRDRNHASIVMWGLLNESTQIPPEMKRQLISYARQFDETRPIIDDSGMSMAFAGNGGGWTMDVHTVGPDAPEPVVMQDVHLYPWCPPPNRTLEWLSVLGEPQKMAETEAMTVDTERRDQWYADLRRQVVEAGNAVFVSEYGVGGLSNLEETIAAFGDAPATPDAAQYRLCRDMLQQDLTGLPEGGKALGGLAGLVSGNQAAQASATKRMTAALRTNPNISGLVFTQWQDCHFEQYAGVVDPWREPKQVYHALKEAFAPLYLAVLPEQQAVYAGRPFSVQVIVVNDSDVTGETQLRLRASDGEGRVLHEEAQPVRLQAGIHDPAIFTLRVGPGTVELAVTLENADGVPLASTADTVWSYAPPTFGAVLPRVARVGKDERLTPFLGALECALDTADVILVEDPLSATRDELEAASEQCKRGKRMVVLAIEPKEYALFGAEPPAVTAVAPGLLFPDGVVLVTSGSIFIPRVHYALDDPLLTGLPTDIVIDEEYRGLMPAFAIKGLDQPAPAGLIAPPPAFASFNVPGRAALVARLPLGQGSLVLSQFQIRDNMGRNPIAEIMLYNLLKGGA